MELKYFMWEWQVHYRVSIENLAKKLFNQLDGQLEPKVFILGILVNENDNRHPICLEPEDFSYQVEKFKSVKSIAKQYSIVAGERNIIHSHPLAQANHDKRIHSSSYVKAIEKILIEEEIYSEMKSFVSSPVEVDGYYVFNILQLNKEKFNHYYQLTKERAFGSYKIYRSLLESLIYSYLSVCSDVLKVPSESSMGTSKSEDEIKKEAAKNFMYTVSVVGNNGDGLHGLYKACNLISSLKYERKEGVGKMIITKENHPNIRMHLQLSSPILLSNYRKVRKFLQLCQNANSIITDSYQIYGLGKIKKTYNPQSESIFVINFEGHYQWTVSHNNIPMMTVEYEKPRFPKERLDREYFFTLTKRLFKTDSTIDIKYLWDVANDLIKTNIGAMLIISDIAEKEAQRLKNHCFPINPVKLNEDLIRQFIAIDGGILIDRNANCYAIGVILDGIATEKGDASRGSRYNSSVRYYEYFKEKAPLMIITISDDGMIDIIPKLKPQIDHKGLKSAINEFKVLGQSEYKHKEFSRLMRYFETHRFYLNQEECKKINSCRKIIENKIDRLKQGIWISYSDFFPNSEMNDSYYLE